GLNGEADVDGDKNEENLVVSPEVSVVIATRDRPQLMRRAVRSVLAQEGIKSIEVLLIFDGVRPNEKLDAHTDIDPGPHAVRTLRNKRTPGLAGARNTGIEAATAPLIAFCDDDDEWKPQKLITQLKLMADPEVLLAATGIEIHSTGGVHQRLAPPTVNLEDLLRSRITELHPSSF